VLAEWAGKFDAGFSWRENCGARAQPTNPGNFPGKRSKVIRRVLRNSIGTDFFLPQVQRGHPPEDFGAESRWRLGRRDNRNRHCATHSPQKARVVGRANVNHALHTAAHARARKTGLSARICSSQQKRTCRWLVFWPKTRCRSCDDKRNCDGVECCSP